MEVIENDGKIMKFKVEINETLANSIRRYIDEIPVLAIDEIEISKNDSALYDEVIAHRLGLVPLKMDEKMSEKTSMELKLDVKKEGFVYSGEIKGANIVYDKIPITLLDKGQLLDLKAFAKMGRGKEHSKFSPGMMFYQDFEDADVKKDELLIVLESWGQMPVESLFIKAIEEMKKDLENFAKKLK